MGRGSKFKATAIAIATVAIGSTELSAQNANPNSPVNGNLGLTTRVVVDSNQSLNETSPGTTVTASESLSFGYTSETSLQSFNFSADAALRYSRTDGVTETSAFDNPGARLGYSRQGANSSFNFSANYRTRDVINALDAEDATVDDITVSTGTLETYGARFGYDFGTDAPFGLSFSASQNFRDYNDTTDPDLVDSQNRSLGVTARLRFSPVTQGTLSVSRSNSEIENADNTEKQTTSYRFGVSHELRRGLSLNANLGYSETEKTESSVTTTTDVSSLSIGASQDLVNGAIFGNVKFSSDDNDRVSLTFGRSMELPDGSLSASVTAINDTGSGTKFLGNLNYSKDLPRGGFNVGLSQSLTTNNDDEDVKFSRLGVGFNQSINSVSRINLSMNVARTQADAGSGAGEKTRGDISASYTQELAEDWNMSVGYRHRAFSETGTSAESDSVFLTLTKNIALGF